MQHQQTAAADHRIGFRLSTGNRWMIGHVTTPHRRLVDLLNQEYRQSLLVEELSVFGRSEHNDVSDKCKYAYVKPPSILFAAPMDEAADTSRAVEQFLWVKKRQEQVRFALGPFVVVGNIHLLEDAKLSSSFLLAGERFAAVTKALIKRDDDSEFVEQEDVILVNKDRIEYLVAE
ncbi:MAG: hypothetical protein HY663_06185 [Chloroflexi bacterium]|nr:hypothetical protein [Chloroflexota bacterium]